MTDLESQLLVAIARNEQRSLLQYVSNSFPWISSGQEAGMAQLAELAEAEGRAASALVRFLARQHIFLHPGIFPVSFMSNNFVSFEHSLPHMALAERRMLAEREQGLPRIHDAEARALVQAIIDTKHDIVKNLDRLAASHPATSSTIR